MFTEQSKGRVYVGVDGSLASLRALREAAAAARQRCAALHVVYVRPRERPNRPPTLALSAVPAPPWDPEQSKWLDNAAMDVIVTCLGEALGGSPTDLDVHRMVLIGHPHVQLASVGRRDDDLLVVGTRGGRRWRHPRRRSVSRYCATHAHCPVLVIPRHEFARTTDRRVHAGRWTLPRDPWREFDAAESREPHPTR